MNEPGKDPQPEPESPQPKPGFGACLAMLGICLFLVWAVISLGGSGHSGFWNASDIFPWVAALATGVLAAVLIVGRRRRE